jgi:hypothetical protein
LLVFLSRVSLEQLQPISLLCYLVEFHHADTFAEQFPCGRVKRFLKNNTQNKMRVGAKGTIKISSSTNTDSTNNA